METLKIIFLAFFQGVAEFLPISSSGHLAVAGKLLGFDPESNLQLGIVLHAGTLISIFIVYFRLLWGILTKRQFRLMLLVIAGSVPAGLAGVALKLSGAAEVLFSRFFLIGPAFFLCGILLYAARKAEEHPEAGTPLEEITFKQALTVGLTQALAILPGLSRSGTTIAAGRLAKLQSAAAAQYSFLLAIVAIGGSALLECRTLLRAEKTAIAYGPLACGFLVSAVTGIFALTWLLSLLKKGNLHCFAYYLWGVGTVVTMLAFWGF